MKIVQIAPEIAAGSGVGGVAYHLEREWRAMGIHTARFTMREARGDWLPAGVPGLQGRLILLLRVVWFSTIGSLLARRYLARHPGAVAVCHNDALCGHVYVNHGLLRTAMRARGLYVLRMLRNPLHLFTAARDSLRYSTGVHRVVVSLAEGERDLLRAAYPRLTARPVVIGNGVDTKRFRPATTSERELARTTVSPDGPLPRDAFCVLFVGHEFARKGLPLAIEALAHAPERVHLLVVGGTTEMIAQARRQSETAGVAARVHWLGRLSDPLPAFHAADAFTLPSAYEANALVVLEALSCGLPVLVTPVGYAPEVIVDGRNGYLIGKKAADLSGRLTELVASGAGAMSEAARESALPHDWSRVARRYLDVLQDLVPGR